MAALAAMFYGQQYPKQVAYIGLGTPRVGNGAFVKKFADVVLDRTRIANGRDPGMSSDKTCVVSTSLASALTHPSVACSQQDTSPSGLLAHRNGGPSRQVRPLPGDTCPDGSPRPRHQRLHSTAS